MSWFPQHRSLLPWFLLVNSLLSFYNTYNCFFSHKTVRDLYRGPNGNQVTPLSMHTFGCWTILSGFVRWYAAYDISNPGVYAIAFWAYFAICVHALSELVVFKTTRWGVEVWVSLGIDLGGLIWMGCQWENYI
ncbi:ergosterol 28 [Tricladium varicosporioides]|nr:ergosterol 28 [Hymenoscyphus varicosporioides]